MPSFAISRLSHCAGSDSQVKRLALVATVHEEGDDVPDAHIGTSQEAQEPDQEHDHILCGS